MIIIKTKEIPEIDKIYYKEIKCFCDKCNVEIKERELYLEVDYISCKGNDYQYKHFCKKCMKDGMYETFINNHMAHFTRYNFYKDFEWHEYDDLEAYCRNYKEESELENIEESEEKI